MMCEPTETFAPTLPQRAAKRIEAETGLAFPEERRRDLLAGLQRIMQDRGFESVEECAAWLLSGRWDEERTALCATHLAVGETYFFRESRAFDLLSACARAKAAEPLGGLRVWSAGCCTGEEAYSIAITLRQTTPELAPQRTCILATDINSQYLQTARAGEYRQWSFRKPLSATQAAFFDDIGDNRLRVRDDIRRMVQFSELNLATDAYPASATNTERMDIIFCRNVLMYFSREQASKVIQRLRNCLVPDGWLVVNPSEASAEMFAGFAVVYHPDAIFFRKRDLNAEAKASVPSGTETASLSPGQAALRTAAPTARARVRQPAKREPQQDIEHEPATVESYHAQALTALESGDHDDARRNLKKALYLQPDFILGHYLLGVVQMAQNRRGDAIRQFNVAGELLAALDDDDIVPGSEGLHAGYLRQSVQAYLSRGSE